MTNKILKLVSKVILAAMLAAQLCIPRAFAETATNVALNKTVTSATHPNGGKDGNSLKPLSYLVDGSNANYLRTAVYGGASNEYLVYEPNTSADIHLCVDLGSTYTIEKLVFLPRASNSLAAKRAFTVYGSNDSTAATAEWKTAYGLKQLYTAASLSQTDKLEIQLTDASYRYIVVTMAGKQEYGAMTIGDLEVWADPSTATTVKVAKNVSLPSNNSKVRVTSASHPQGGMDGSTSNLRPLSNLINGTSSGTSYFRLSTAAGASASNGYHEIYNPVGGDDVIIHACLDLGDMYDLTQLVISPRNNSGTIKSDLIEGLTFYGSNDPKAATTDWQNAEKDVIKQFTAADCPNTGNYKYVTITEDYTINVDSSKNAYRYIIITQNKGNNKYNYYYITFGNLAVYSTGINAAYQKKMDFYDNVGKAAAASFETLVKNAVSDGVIAASSVTAVAGLDELDGLSEYFVWSRDAVKSGKIKAGFTSVSSEEDFLYLLKAAVVLKAAAGGVSSELDSACTAYAAQLNGLFSQGVELAKFKAAYRVPSTVNAENVIKAIKFADAISFINGATDEKIAEVLTARYADLGFELTYLTERTTALEVAKRLDNTIPEKYLTEFGTVVVGIIDEISGEVQVRISKETEIEPSEKGIKITIPVTGDFANCTFNILVTDPSGDEWLKVSKSSAGLSEPVKLELLYADNGNELGEYTVSITVVNNVTSISTPVTVKGWCVEADVASACYAELNSVGAEGLKQSIEDRINVDRVLSREVVERIIPLADMGAYGKFFVIARAGMAKGTLGGTARTISELETLKACLKYSYMLKALDSEAQAKITEAYNKYGDMISGFLTPTFSLSVFSESYRTVEGDAEAIVKNIGFCDALSQIKGKTYKGVEDILTTYYDFLGVDLDYFTEKGVEVIEVAKKLDTGLPEAYYTDFGSKIKAMVDGCASENGGQDPVTTPQTPSNKLTLGSGGGGGNDTKKEKAESGESTPTEEIGTKPAFSDLGNVPWAVEAIGSLSSNGIVSGVGDGVFEPEKSVKREEFAKMIVLAFALYSDAEGGECSFRDTSKEDWHYTYISAACGNGVTNGTDDVTFGVGESITRQDLAVMCYRAALKKGLTLKAGSTEVKFTDGQKVADYAYVAINVLNQNGIVNGFDDATIRPQATATRAEAATIIYRLLTMLEKEGLI